MLLVICGLGNPGKEYTLTRHNVGFMVVDRCADRWKMRFRPGKGEYLVAEGQFQGKQVLLLKPLTYMNLSGLALKQITEEKPIDSSSIMIVYDDVDLPLGKIRLRPKGSAGMHRGMASVIYYLGTDEVPRCRVGIRSGEDVGDLVRFVLSPFSPEELEVVEGVVDRAVDAMEVWIGEGLDVAMNRFNA